MAEERYPCMTYVCGVCGKSGVRLWRDYNTMLCYQTLRCMECAEKYADEHGHKNHGHWREGSDQIGSLIPAVPDMPPDAEWKLPDEATYWGYTSVPSGAVGWWYGLPTGSKPMKTPRWLFDKPREGY